MNKALLFSNKNEVTLMQGKCTNLFLKRKSRNSQRKQFWGRLFGFEILQTEISHRKFMSGFKRLDI